MAAPFFNSFLGRLMGDTSIIATAINLATDTIKLSLHTSSYTPNLDDDEFFDDVDNEISTTGSYTAGIAGGYTLTWTGSTDDTDNEGVGDAVDVSITSATITARYAVFRKDTAVASTSPVMWYIDFVSDQSSSNGTFTIAFSSEGVVNIG